MKPISDARTCKDGRTYLRERLLVLAWRMQCTARTEAVHCRGGCSALRERLQCTASEMDKTGTEIASPILDKRIGRRDSPHTGHCSPLDTSGRALNACAYSLIQLAKLEYKRI